MEQTEPAATRPRAAWLAAAALAVVLLGAVGAFGGHWLWAKYLEREAASAKLAAETLAVAERATPRWLHEYVLRQSMNDPDAARLRNQRESSKGVAGSWWCGEVNGRNRMGAMVGFRRYVVGMVIEDEVLALPENERVAKVLALSSVDIDPVDHKAGSVLQQIFESAWGAHCD